MGRFYRPESKPDDSAVSTTSGAPGGRIYRPSSGVAVPEDQEDLQAPAKSASKKEWAAYAESLGATKAETKSLNRDAFVEKYGGTADGEAAPVEPPPVDSAAETGPEQPVEAAKDLSVATGALEPPTAPEDVVTDPAAETVQEDPIESAVEVGGPAGATQPKANASTEDWKVFAKSQGASDEDLDGLGRNDIRAKFAVI